MNIKNLSLFALTALVGAGSTSASDFWSMDFNSGIPKTFTILDRDGLELVKDNYKNASTTEGWVVARTDGYGYSAVSLSCTDNDSEQDNWLITEPIAITSDNAYLRWEAKTILKYRPESYKVMLSTTDTSPESFVEIANVNAESNNWNTHLHSLSDYNGQTIYLAFVCNSVNKFILAVDNIAVGELSDHNVLVNDNTQKFCGDVETVNVNGSIINAGKNYDIVTIGVSSMFDDGTSEETVVAEENYSFNINEKIDYSFDIPVEVGKNTEYTVWFETSEGERIGLLSDYVICSYFQRKMVVEKGTGTWCNGCPDGTAYMHFLKDRYKDELIYVSVHVRDILECNYQTGLSRWLTQVPLIIINRYDEGGGVMGATQFKQSGAFNYEPFYEIAKRPTYVGVKATAERADNVVKIHADVEFAKDYDNSSDIYRMCYAIYENQVSNPNNTGFDQVNNCNFSPLSQEFYYMPAKVPASLMLYDNVAREGSLSKTGVEASFDSSILSGDKKSFDYELTIPENVVDKDNISVVVYVMNTKTAEILNADKINLSVSSSIKGITADVDSEISLNVAGNKLIISSVDVVSPYSVYVISVDGKVLKSVRDISLQNNVFDLSDIEGFVIIKVTQGSVTKTVKAIL